MEHLSIRPNKMVVYTRECKPSINDYDYKGGLIIENGKEIKTKNNLLGSNKNLNKHNFELSPQAQKNIQEKITWLYHFSRKKTILLQSGKVISDFRMNFVTLTLPSVQRHSSDFLVKNCWNQLITELANKCYLENYVWRLEYQKNGNIHFHLATDVFMNYNVVRDSWNRILEKFEYVTEYSNKFKRMSLLEYWNNYSNKEKSNFAEIQKRYAKGCREDWKKPHSVDVKVCTNSKAVAFYISKYFGKLSSPGSQTVLEVNESNSGNSRLWFCSRSLSKLKAISDIREAMREDFLALLFRAGKFRKVVCDYCIVYYYDMKDLDLFGFQRLSLLFDEYAGEKNYEASYVLTR